MSKETSNDVVSGFVLWGLVSGFIALLCWRFVTPPDYGDFVVLTDELKDNTFTVSVFDAALIPMLPAVVTFPLAGVVVGSVVGIGISRIDRLRGSAGWRSGLVAVSVTGAMLGSITGAVSAAVLRWSPPTIMVRNNVSGRTGMPSQLDVPLMWVTLPVAGVVVGVLIAVMIRRSAAGVDSQGSRRRR